MPISKPFAIATEGPTVDGRNISRDWISQMAKNYDPKSYTAVANLEHYLSMMPDSVFSAHGKVVSLSTQETELMGEKKLQLMAVVDASEYVVSLQKAGKKLFASVEIANNFLNKGMAYLTGLAFTDNPASIGTESMKFSAKPENIYSFSNEINIEFEADATAPILGESLLAKVKELLNFKSKKDEDRFADVGAAVEAIATSQRDLLDKYTELAGLSAELATANETITALQQQVEKDRAEFTAFKEKLDITPNGTGNRPAASGGDGLNKTDC
ncbi:hypothetical protein OYT1_ch1578 [Ferriphaselus amnicola]|uniref:Capsid scaffolding protein n=1 Tax=Ferriphaselus amnicola TaxID=1188319 RepID=A0A2Z6GD55_9PROT|nr:GPO family capsid scaffolding protein [Ferriphaselus amnicola]BBE51125.1 hypothetical protein OYT1_ch1578 [Ferriphaselus amnicola]